MAFMGAYAIVVGLAMLPLLVILLIVAPFKLLCWLLKAIIRGVKHLREYS